MTLSERDAINRAEGRAESKKESAENIKKAIQELLDNKQITPETASLLYKTIKA